MTRDLELRLMGTGAPEGEIAVKDLTALASALQELITRIGRDVVNTSGPGRTRQYMEQFAELRLRTVEVGSTLLGFSQGPVDQLDVELAEQREADAQFWLVIEDIGQDKRPAGMSDLVAESAGRLVAALRQAAPRATFSGTTHSDAVFVDTGRIHVETWVSIRRVQTDVQMEAHGRLERVDLRTHEFRVRDDVGWAVDLKHVVDDTHVGPHVGRWVIASGEAVLEDGRLVALDKASITLADDPTENWEKGGIQSLDEILASASGPDPDGGIDLSDDEFDAFLEAARG